MVLIPLAHMDKIYQQQTTKMFGMQILNSGLSKRGSTLDLTIYHISVTICSLYLLMAHCLRLRNAPRISRRL